MDGIHESDENRELFYLLITVSNIMITRSFVVGKHSCIFVDLVSLLDSV